MPALLQVPDPEGPRAAIGAAGCRRAAVEQVRGRGGGHPVAVEGNQPAPQRAAHAAFAQAGAAEFAGCPTAATAGGGRGRHGEGYVAVVPEPEGIPAEWADVRSAVVVARGRGVTGGT